MSPETALALADAVRHFAGTDLGLGLTSIAGPTGGSDTKPVGLTYIALSGGTRSLSEEHRFEDDRSGNIRLSAEAALLLVLRFLAEG